MFVDIITVFIL